MHVSRAGFLKICGAVLVGRNASALLASAGVAVPALTGHARALFRVEQASAALFRPHLQSPFAVRAMDGTRLALVLAGVTEQPLAHGVEQFSLIFHAPPGAPLAHGVHAFQHAALGTFDLFIAPVGGASTARTSYEACFSRHVIAREAAATADRRAPGAQRGGTAWRRSS